MERRIKTNSDAHERLNRGEISFQEYLIESAKELILLGYEMDEIESWQTTQIEAMRNLNLLAEC